MFEADFKHGKSKDGVKLSKISITLCIQFFLKGNKYPRLGHNGSKVKYLTKRRKYHTISHVIPSRQ